MKLKIYNDSENYVGRVVKLPVPTTLKGLDNLVAVNIFGNQCLLSKNDNLDDLYIFFPAGTILSTEFLHKNNLFRYTDLNQDKTKTGYIQNSCRVKAVKFKGHISTGIVLPIHSLSTLGINGNLEVGQEFNEIDGIKICQKYVVPRTQVQGTPKSTKVLDKLVEKRAAPEHPKTLHLLKFIDIVNLHDIILTVKLHGTSFRIFNGQVLYKKSWLEKIVSFLGCNIQKYRYGTIVGSRHCIKSVDFKQLDGKNHFYKKDIYTQVCLNNFKDKLHEGEALYGEIVGSFENGKEVQKGYSYGFATPKIYIYRASLINGQGVEVDMPWSYVKKRCHELNVEHVPEIFYGSLEKYFSVHNLTKDTYYRETFAKYLESKLDQPSIIDKTVIEEGFVLRIENYPKAHFYKIKSPKFILFETKCQDEGVEDLEESNMENENGN